MTHELRRDRRGRFATTGRPPAPSPAAPPGAPAPFAAAIAGDAPADVYAYGTQLAAGIPGVRLDLSGPNAAGIVAVSFLRVDDEHRGQGGARRALEQLCADADRWGWTLAITPKPPVGADKDRLAAFYAEHGFSPNTGRRHHSGEAMLRPPQP